MNYETQKFQNWCINMFTEKENRMSQKAETQS